MPIPGPPPSPSGDNLDDVAAAGGLHTYQLALHREHGDVAAFRLPGSRLVSVADPVLLEQVARVNKRPDELFEFLAPLFETGNLQVMPAEEHIPWRRTVLSAVAGRRSHEAHFDSFARLATDLADRWAAAPGPIALQQELSELSLRMICQYALGMEMNTGDLAQRVVTSFEEVLSEYLGASYGMPYEKGRAEKALAFLRGAVDHVLAERRAGERPDLITLMAEAGESPARIRDSVLVMMLAAHHTTGVAISWTLHLLTQHPEVTDRLRAELTGVLGDRRVPAFTDLARLPELEATLKEAMRLYPPGPYGARETTEDLVLGGHELPAGTTVFIPIWAVHLNPRVWPDPERFDPGRFTPERSAGRPRLAHIPFGFGPRSCEGARLAMMEAQLVLATLLHRFTFTPVDGHPVVPIERFVLWAEHDIKMTVTPT
ncbi:cytochrome P450 [Nonomuraea typhae]|uniref:cytochrome P450 n=1 Tax=Nonomuraea typhae TaxID=2603600 RepID=UPI0012F96CC1|nr:cytochrome P450 [Nonomuraea typhae]